MTLSFYFEEVAEILNYFVVKEIEDQDDINFFFIPAYKGIQIKFNKLRWKRFNYTGKIKMQFSDSPGKEVVVSIKMKNLFMELVKKIIFRVGYILLRKFSHKEDDNQEFDIFNYVIVGGSKIHVYLNDLLEQMHIPFHLRFITVNDNSLEIDGIFRERKTD